MRSLAVLLGLGLVLVAIAVVVRTGVLARKEPGKPLNAAMRAAMEGNQYSPEELEAITRAYPTAIESGSGVRYVVLQPGEGPTPMKGQVARVHYTGRFLNGETFDASAEHGGPFNFQVGLGRVIAGWDEVVATMRKGEKRTVIIPWWLAYGEKGRGKIPARATLVFDLELIAIE